MKPVNFLAFDIETIPMQWDEFSESQQEYILRRQETDEEKEKRKSEMALTPMTAQCVCIGLQLMAPDPDSEGGYKMIKRAALSVDNSFSDDDQETVILPTGDECFLYNEKKMFEAFWKILAKYDPCHLISFNGRNFDVPFVMLRSALLGMRPGKNLMQGTKFNYMLHTDLIDELSFFSPSYTYGATKKFNFDFYTRAFGIPSPKGGGIDGSKVAEFFAAGKINDISEYCLRDVKATWELFCKWRDLLKF